MGFRLSEIEEGSQIVLHISNASKKMDMNAVIKNFMKENIAVIELDYQSDKKISFENVLVDMEYCFEGIMPIVWRNVKIVSYKSEYVLQASSEGMRHNRRESFRVGVGAYAQFRREGHGMEQIILRDICISGFSLTDKRKDLNFSKGDKIVVKFSDLGYSFELHGRVVRSEEHEHLTIYGLELCNLCKGLSAYVNAKQRLKSQ